MAPTVRRARAPYTAVTAADRRLDLPETPRPAGVVTEFWRLMGCTSRRVAERHLAITLRGINRLPEACRRAGRLDYLATAFAHADAVRSIGAEPLRLDAHLLCHLAKDAATENVTITEFLAYNKSPEERAALRKQTIKLQGEAAELLAALDATV